MAPKLPSRGTLPRRAWDLLAAAHVRLYRLTGGRLVGRYRRGSRILLLEHTGRRSGRVRTLPLVYVPHGDDLVVVAAAGASDEHPQWFLNLRAHPAAEVTVGSERRPVTARIAGPDEKEALWPKLVERNPTWEGYRRRTERDIPVVLLERRGR